MPLHLIVQFCDNCAAQYKSRHPFSELARSFLKIIRVYFGEKHGKSHADALFGRLKAFMAYKIKARHFVVTDAYEFFKYCREYYQTPKLDTCQHYRVEFQFIHHSDVRRHHDCDLDQHVPNTHHLYSVRNTPEPLKLKLRLVPCLCPPCIHDDGSECLNADYTDAWKMVYLIPTKGSNKRKYQKRKCADAEIRPTKQTSESVPVVINDEDSSDDELPEISFDAEPFKKWKEKKQIAENETNLQECVTDTVTDTVTDSVTDQETKNIKSNAEENRKSCEKTCTWKNVEEPITAADFVTSSESTSDSINDIEVIGICEQRSKEFQMCAENALLVSHENISVCELIRNDVPDSIYWHSILTSLESCNTFEQLQKLANELKEQIPPLPPCLQSTYNPEEDDIDFVAQAEIPIDGPRLLGAILTLGDGNCLCRALSRAYFNTDKRPLEIRVRIIIEGVTNMQSYISDDCLERGASCLHENSDLPTVSPSSTHQDRISLLIVSPTSMPKKCNACSRVSCYMGLWQLAQASTVLRVPVHTIYPHRGESTICNDFNRIFFPAVYPPEIHDDEPVVIMSTGLRHGAVPIHFFPLLKQQE